MDIVLFVLVSCSLLDPWVIVCFEEDHTVIDLLVLVPWPDSRNYSGRDGGLGLLSGGRIAAKEINNRTDLLAGYKINIIEGGHEACGLTVQSLGLVNLVHYSINSNSNVCAILGLYCSTSTESLSLLAGRDEIEFLQLSSANSPIFNDRIDRFPHLWKFLQSAGTYADMMIHLMEEHDWNRIGIISSEGNTYYEGIVNILINKVNENNKTILYHGELVRLESEIERQIITGLTEGQARIVFIAAETVQIVSFLCSAYQNDMIYPNYLWIIPDESLDSLFSQSTCGASILKTLEGSVLSKINLIPKNKTAITIETSNISYNEYIEKYDRELEQVKMDYSDLVLKTGTEINRLPGYSALLYDQVWAFSLALNNALPELIAKNVSFKLGESTFTHTIEKYLRNLSFQGASGLVKFNEFRELSTPIDVYQVINNDSVKVGDRINFDTSNHKVGLTFSSELDDELRHIYPVFHKAITTTMAFCTLLLLILATAVLFAMMVYRNEHEIKAVSPMLSLLMYFGCYMLIFAMVLLTISGSLQLSDNIAEGFCHSLLILRMNGVTLILVTLFMKLKRVYRIFHNRRLRRLGWQYENWAMMLQVILIAAFPNVIYIIVTVIPPESTILTSISTESTLGSVTVINEYNTHCYGTFEHGINKNLIFRMILLMFNFSLGIMNMYLASRLTGVPSTDFKNTKLVNILIVLIWTTLIVTLVLVMFFFVNEATLYVSVIEFTHLFLTVLYCELLLFVPSVVTVLKRKWLHQNRHSR